MSVPVSLVKQQNRSKSSLLVCSIKLTSTILASCKKFWYLTSSNFIGHGKSMGGNCICRACAFLCPLFFLQQHQQCGPHEPDSNSPAALGDGGMASSPWQSESMHSGHIFQPWGLCSQKSLNISTVRK